VAFTLSDGTVETAYMPFGNTGYRPSAALANYPLKIGFASATIGARCLSTGYDLRVCLESDPLTVLPLEINNFVLAGGVATGNVWVNVASVPSSSDLALRVYYGDAGAVQQANPQLVWNSNYAAVYHCEQDPSGAAPQILDSTANAKHLTTVGTMLTGDLVAAKVGKGLDLDGVDDGAWGALWASVDTNLHMTYWQLPTAGTSAEQIAMHNGADLAGYGVGIRLTSRAALFDYIAWCYDNAWTGGVWDHIAFGRDTTNWTGYVNGGAVGGWTSTTTPRAPVTCSSIGQTYSGIRPFNGVVDELRMLLISPSTPLIAYDYTTQLNDAWATWGAEVYSPAGGIYRPFGPAFVSGRDRRR